MQTFVNETEMAQWEVAQPDPEGWPKERRKTIGPQEALSVRVDICREGVW